jgi:hypothetical protein
VATITVRRLAIWGNFQTQAVHAEFGVNWQKIAGIIAAYKQSMADSL